MKSEGKKGKEEKRAAATAGPFIQAISKKFLDLQSLKKVNASFKILFQLSPVLRQT